MKLRKILLVVALISALALLMPAAHVLAGAGPEPPSGATILPTQIWGVVTLYCSPAVPDLAVLRIKRIDDCNVYTQLLVDYAWEWGCPVDDAQGLAESKPVDWYFAPGSIQFFANIPQGSPPIQGTPYINKVKNFKQEIIRDNDDNITSNVTSFEAQFGFYELATP
jgi:hypothetical protein